MTASVLQGSGSTIAPRIAIVGGGIMGLSCAWRLARAGARVEVIEARQCGQGATLASLGALWPASPLTDGPLQQLHRQSLWEFEAFVQEVAAESGVAVGFRRLGRLELLHTAKGAQRAGEEAATACKKWPSFGPLPVMEYLSPAAVTALVPGVVATPFGALLCRATAQVYVAELVAALRAVCVQLGVAIREGTTASPTELLADQVLITAGAWSGPLISGVAIGPVKGEALAVQMRAGVGVPMIVKSGGTYLVPWEEKGEILVGATTMPGAGFDETITPETRAELLAGAELMMPSLKGANVLRQWAGLRPRHEAKGHWPVMGPMREKPNVYLCAGHFKTGIGMAPRVSRLMAEMILTGKAPAELLPFMP